jgi:hypothetical protein
MEAYSLAKRILEFSGKIKSIETAIYKGESKQSMAARLVKTFPIHSIFLAIYPILYLLSANIIFTPITNALRALLISVGFTVFFLIIFRLVLKSWQKAGLLCSLLILLFYTFGHVANTLASQGSANNQMISNSALGWIWLAILLVLSFIIVRSKNPTNITGVLNLCCGLLLIFPLFTIYSTMSIRNSDDPQAKVTLSEIRGDAAALASVEKLPDDQLPDIYYIIVDGYERPDFLAALYNYDDQSFIQGLRERGFFVADRARSNFLNTTYSLNTAVNLIDINQFPAQLFKKARYDLQTNFVSDFLREKGYQIIVYDSGTGDTNNQYADIFVSPEAQTVATKSLVNPFEQLLLRTTLIELLFQTGDSALANGQVNGGVIDSINRDLDLRRARIDSTLDHLPDKAAQPGHYFHFAHLYSPHIPFLYGPNGTALKYQAGLNLYWYEVEPDYYPEYYGYQIDRINQGVLDSIDQILTRTTKPVVIILQSDHGDDFFLDWDSPSPEGVDARSAIIFAIYYSDGEYGAIYPTITTVNTFRLVFNHWFGTQYPTLPDRVYFHEHPLETPPNELPEFLDACVNFQVCQPSSAQ